jgi:hypothetical protein
MSALPSEADIRQCIEHVCFVPQADIAIRVPGGSWGSSQRAQSITPWQSS